MQNLVNIQRATEMVYDRQTTSSLLSGLVTEDIINQYFEGEAQHAEAFVIMLTETLKPDVLIQSAISRLMNLLDVRPSAEAVQQCLRLLEKYDGGLYDLQLFEHRAVVVPKVTLKYDMREAIRKKMFLPPMVCEPEKWVTPVDGGYLTKRLPAITKWRNMHDGHLALDVLNKLQSIPFELDHFIFENCKDTVPDKELKMDEEVTVSALIMDKRYHFVWRYDGRGRHYSYGHHMNLQSRSYKKALNSLANKEYLTEVGRRGLYIHIANTCGMDKLTFDEREKYARNRVAPILAAYKAGTLTGIDVDDILDEDPILYIKAVKALMDDADGLPTGVTVDFDSTSSGIQLMATMSGCQNSARMTNLIDTGRREDAYTNVTDIMAAHLAEVMSVARKDAKQALMTHYYCSKKTPRVLFNDEQLEVFYNVTSNIFTGCEHVMSEIVNSWSDDDEFSWTLPDGHVAVVRPTVKEVLEINWHGCEFVYDFMKQGPSGSHLHLPANIVQSVDGYVARQMVRLCDFDMYSAHDAFSMHPNHWETACQKYREILAGIADSNILQDILREIRGDKNYKFNKLTEDLSLHILNSVYALS